MIKNAIIVCFSRKLALPDLHQVNLVKAALCWRCNLQGAASMTLFRQWLDAGRMDGRGGLDVGKRHFHRVLDRMKQLDDDIGDVEERQFAALVPSRTVRWRSSPACRVLCLSFDVKSGKNAAEGMRRIPVGEKRNLVVELPRNVRTSD